MLTTDQKWDAITAFDPSARVEHRGNLHDWFIADGMHIGDGSGVIVGTYGNGTTPQEAVDEHWRIYVEELGPDRYISAQIREGAEYVQYRVRWNGFRWANINQYELERIQKGNANTF